MESTFVFMRVRGIAIGAHWSWLLVAGLVVWTLASALFPATYPGLDGGTYLVMSLVATGLFFGSVLLHELGHALRAVREGIDIREITLWLLGGVAHLGERPRSPGAEFRVAIAGPVITVGLAALFWSASLAGTQLAWPAPVIAIADYLARINVIVLLFNLVPALPLDGGRVLRSWVWHQQRSYVRATRWAARGGRAFGLALVALGVLTLFTGGGFSGLWFVLLGWFLAQASQAELTDALLRRALQDLRVRDLMRPDPVTARPDDAVSDLVDLAERSRFSGFPVVDGGEFRGFVTLRQAAAVPPEQRHEHHVSDIMVVPDGVPRVHPDDELADALGRLTDQSRRAVVVADGRVTGLLSASDIAHALRVQELRGLPPTPRRRGGALIVGGVVTLAILLAISLLYHPPYLAIAPGPTFDVTADVTVSGRPVTEVNGEYLATSVTLSQPTLAGAVIDMVRPDRELVPVEAVLPRGVSASDYVKRQRRAYEESRRLAAAAAARAVGLPVQIGGTGMIVTDIARGAPAASRLREGDVIVAVDGRSIRHAGELQRIVSSRPPGTVYTLDVERGSTRIEVRVASAELPSLANGVGFGITARTRDLSVDLPFEVTFADRANVAGPSAGLAYALVIADILAPADYADGETIAATGTVAMDGSVGPVGRRRGEGHRGGGRGCGAARRAGRRGRGRR